MSGAPSRIRSILGHLLPQPSTPAHIHHLSPTFFLERAAAVEPHADAIFHIATDGVTFRRTYAEFADRARGLAYYLKKHKLTRVGILAPNTPAFLESIYGIVAGGGVVVPANYRLKEDDIAYIFEYAEVDCIIVDKEFESLLGAYTKRHPKVPLIVDLVSRRSMLAPPSSPKWSIVMLTIFCRMCLRRRACHVASLTKLFSRALLTIKPKAAMDGQSCSQRRITRMTCSPFPSRQERHLDQRAWCTPIEAPISLL